MAKVKEYFQDVMFWLYDHPKVSIGGACLVVGFVLGRL